MEFPFNSTLQKTLSILSVAGFLLFSAVFGLLQWNPETLERAAKGFIIIKIEQKLEEHFVPLKKFKNLEQISLLKELNNQYLNHIENLKQFINSDLSSKIANEVARLCTCKTTPEDIQMELHNFKKIEAGIKQSIEEATHGKILKLNLASDSLIQMIRGYYFSMIQRLTHDLKIFSGSNSILFLLIFGLTFMRSKNPKTILIPGLILFVGTLASLLIYLFGQNWFFALVFNDFMGWGYLIYVGIISMFLADIILLKARISLWILNFVANVMGSFISACG